MSRSRISLHMLVIAVAFLMPAARHAIAGGIPSVSSPAVDCSATKAAWEADVSLRQYMATHNCTCPNSDAMPVCTPTGGYSSGYSGDDNGGSRGIFGWIDYWAERLEEKQRVEGQRRRQEAYNLNEQGNRAYLGKDWAKAIDFYEKALEMTPDDKVIRQNLKNASNEKQMEDDFRREQKKRDDELLRKQSEFRNRMNKLVALMPAVKPLSLSGASLPTGPGDAKVPLPGFSSAQWKEYLDAQDTVMRLYAKLNRDDVLSDADAQVYLAALRRRNELWMLAMEQPLDPVERSRLRIPLPIITSKALMNLTLIMQGLKPGNNQTSHKDPASPGREVATPLSRADSVIINSVADFYTDKLTDLGEDTVGDSVKEAHGKKMKTGYGWLVNVGHILVQAKEGGISGAGAETADLAISLMTEPSVVARADLAVEGGRRYSNVACQALKSFMENAMQATGATFDTEAFLKNLNESRTDGQRGVAKWIQYCE